MIRQGWMHRNCIKYVSFSSQLTFSQPGGRLHCWCQPTAVEGGGERQTSLAKELSASCNGWQCSLCHRGLGWWWWWPRLNLILGSNQWVLAIRWQPCCGEKEPCSCCCLILNDRIRVFPNNVDTNTDTTTCTNINTTPGPIPTQTPTIPPLTSLPRQGPQPWTWQSSKRKLKFVMDARSVLRSCGVSWNVKGRYNHSRQKLKYNFCVFSAAMLMLWKFTNICILLVVFAS